MLTRRKKAWAVAAACVAVLGAGIAWRFVARRVAERSHPALDGVPAGALLVAAMDVDALRASSVGAPVLKQGREIPGIGKIRDACGFDPVDRVRDLAFAIPAGGSDGDFGLVASGDVDDAALLACASKVIEARGGMVEIGAIGGFRSVRDVGQGSTDEGVIAVRAHGPILLGGAKYVRAMVDALEGRAPSIRSSVAHNAIAGELGDAALRVSIVLTPDQREAVSFALREAGQSSPASVMAAGLAVRVGATVSASAVLACDDAAGCQSLRDRLDSERAARAKDLSTRLIGVGDALDKLSLVANGTSLRATLELPEADAATLVDRILTIRGFRHPMPSEAPSASPRSAVQADDTVRPSASASASPASSAKAPPKR